MSTETLYPTLKISVSNQQASGYFREDTIRSANPIQKTGPGSFYIPSEGNGIRFVQVKDNKRKILDSKEAIAILTEKKPGHDSIVPESYPIRYIKNCPSIDMEWQKQHAWVPSFDPKGDQILVIDTYKELSYSEDPSLYNYLKAIMWNASLPYRQEHITPLFYEVQDNLKATVDIDRELILKDALEEWSKLFTKTAAGNVPNVDKVNGLSVLLNVHGKNPTEKIHALLLKAKTDPANYLLKAKVYEEEVITDVSHAISLGVISIQGHTAIFTFNNKRVDLSSITSGSKNSVPEKLGEALKSEEHKELYVQLKNHIQIAKEAQLN